MSRITRLACAIALVAAPTVTAQPRPVRPLLTLGSETGDDGELFTNIRAVAIDQHDRIIVLDAGEKRLVVFRPTGERLQYLGRAGAGPNEFQSPVAVIATATGRVLVLDPQSGRLTAYDARGSDSLRFDGSWQLPLPAFAMCGAGERLFVLADVNERLIHEVALGERVARVIRAFGEPKSHHPLATKWRPLLIAGSQLACSQRGSRIAFAPRQLGEVRVFTDDGTEVLFSRLTPFREIEITAIERGFRYSYPSGMFQQNVALQVDDRGAVTVQIATYRRKGTRPRPDTYEVRYLTTGGALATVSSSGSFFGAVTTTRLVCWREDPFPQVLVYDLSRLKGSSCP